MQCCKNCTERWVDTEKGITCHSSCEKYKAFAKECEKGKKAREKKTECFTQKRLQIDIELVEQKGKGISL